MSKIEDWDDLQEYKKLIKGVNVVNLNAKILDIEALCRQALEEVRNQNNKIHMLETQIQQLQQTINTLNAIQAMGRGPTQK